MVATKITSLYGTSLSCINNNKAVVLLEHLVALLAHLHHHPSGLNRPSLDLFRMMSRFPFFFSSTHIYPCLAFGDERRNLDFELACHDLD